MELSEEVDVAFSVGLIEHFDTHGTRQAIESHFRILRPQGIAVIGFPTPTLLYRLARRASELAGMWAFPDERPLDLQEVVAAVGQRGRLLERTILWPTVFTQYLTVWQKVGE